MVKPTRITNQIRDLRHAAGEMTQAELARRLGLTRQTVIAIEQGRYSPSLEVAFQIARVFQVPLDGVFHYPDDNEPADDKPADNKRAGNKWADDKPAGNKPADEGDQDR